MMARGFGAGGGALKALHVLAAHLQKLGSNAARVSSRLSVRGLIIRKQSQQLEQRRGRVNLQL